MYSKSRLFKLEHAKFNAKHHCLHRTKVFEVAKFIFLANFRCLTLIFLCWIYFVLVGLYFPCISFIIVAV